MTFENLCLHKFFKKKLKKTWFFKNINYNNNIIKQLEDVKLQKNSRLTNQIRKSLTTSKQ